jgi:hypothetical protein
MNIHTGKTSLMYPQKTACGVYFREIFEAADAIQNSSVGMPRNDGDTLTEEEIAAIREQQAA